MSRTDRVLVAVALLILLLAFGSYFGFDGWLAPGVREGEAIAQIVEGGGDVRVKFNQEMRWQSARVSQKLQYDDAVFAGENSQVRLQIGDSELQMQSNTLIVLRKENLSSFMNLSFGGLKGMLAKNEKLVIQTSSGEKFELKANAASKIAIRSEGGKTSVKVVEGNASVVKDGTQQNLATRDEMQFAGKAKTDALIFRAPELPVVYSFNERETVRFAWDYSSGRPLGGLDEFGLEASEDASFRELAMREQIRGKTEFFTSLSVPADVYFRVKDRSGVFSETRRLRLLRPVVPSVVTPAADAVMETEVGQRLSVPIRLSEPQPDSKIWLQVARDSEFNDVIERKTLIDPHTALDLPMGQYYLRVKAEYRQMNADGSTLQTEWSVPHPLLVRERLGTKLLQARLPAVLTIPNRPYPAQIYGKDAESQEYLARTAQFARFFERFMARGHELVVNRAGRDEVRLTSPNFPAAWIKPGTQRLNYRNEATGQVTMEEKSQALRIEMEAPNRLGASIEEGLTWSPILFAKSYEGELGLAGGDLRKFTSVKPNYFANLPRHVQHGFRVRALGENSRPISGWSQIHTFSLIPPPAVVEQSIVQNHAGPEHEIARAPAQEATSTLKMDQPKRTAWEKVGLWIWMGTGVNFFDVRQTVSNTADVSYQNTKGPSFFGELGYMAKNRLGAIFGYKRTPGEIQLGNYPINKSEFVWDTYSLEGIFGLPWAGKLWNKTLNWGLRAGLQKHSFPFLHIQTGRNVINSQSYMTAASLGFFFETTGRWKQHMHMRWQQPVASSTSGGDSFEIQPRIAFDGSLGTSYLLTERLKTGLFWYGQMHNYDFTYRSSTQTNSGYQSLFYSNMELRLGYDF